MKIDSEIPIRNPKKRELSPFMAEQMLYDYATNNMDPLRERALANTLSNSPELAKALDDIIYGMTYCHHLQKTKLSPEFLSRIQAPMNWQTKVRYYKNLRQWNQSVRWIIEAGAISIAVLLIGLVVPWPKYVKLFLEKQNPDLFLSEVPRNISTNTETHDLVPDAGSPRSVYTASAELGSVNPEFTTNKLMASLPQLGASIEHHSLQKSHRGIIAPVLRVSVPSSQTEALLHELKSQGQLTWLTAPGENEPQKKIFGMELWIIKQKPAEGKIQIKDQKGE